MLATNDLLQVKAADGLLVTTAKIMREFLRFYHSCPIITDEKSGRRPGTKRQII